MSQPSHSHAPMEHKSGGHRTFDQHAASGAHRHQGGTGWHAAAAVTLHCLTGCLIGEWMGLAMGVALSLPVGVTVILASALAYASGFGLTMWPLLRSGMTFWPALTTVFIGEAVSIGVMEVAMNVVDYAMGGMRVKSLIAPRYWEALAAASLAGFLAAWPINFWLLGRHLKKCH
jgi:hypothetical protein